MLRALFFSLIILFHFSLIADNTGISRNEYIGMWKDEAVFQMAEHKIPASITLAQGILESGDGNSRLAREGNNHFGIKCHNEWTGKRIYEDDDAKHECFRQYHSAKESYEDHSLFLKRQRYESLFKLQPDDYKSWAKGLKECGYATNPKYPQLLIGIIEEFKLQEFDKEGMEYISKNRLPDRGDAVATPSTVLTDTQTEKPKSKRRRNSKDEQDDRITITVGNNHNVLKSDNGIKYVVVKSGDTPQSIADDFDLHVWIIRRYNDLNDGDTLREGDIIYLQPKRNNGTDDSYTIKSGDTLRSISQKYGIKLNKLKKYNALDSDKTIASGTKLKLRR